MRSFLFLAFGVLLACDSFAATRLYTRAAQPATCAIGDLWVDTDGTAGEKFYICEATNTWVRHVGYGAGANPSFNTLNVSGGNLAAANKQVTKAWQTGLPYTADVTSVIHGGKHWIARTTHTAGSTTEPGVGASYGTVWAESGGAGDDLGDAAASDIIALFGGGSCSGYLYSDGTCSTPSGAAHDAVTLGTDAAAILGLSTQEITLDSQTANYFFAAPNGSAGDPTFRAIVAADIPTLNQNTTGSAATLTTPRTLGGVSFDGSANINLPGVNTAGNQNTSGTAAGLSGTPNITVGTVTLSGMTSSAADGAHYLDIVNGVAISSTATLGRIAYYNGRMRLADGTDWDGYFLEDTDASANGLSLIGAANYAAMRTLLDLEAGTDFNAYDDDIADLADGSLTASKVAGASFAPASKATTYTIGTDSADESYGGTVYVTSATTITAPAITTGMNFAVVTIGDIAVSLDVNASDRMILDGVTLADGDKATNSSKAGDTIVCQYYSADGWYCWSSTVLGGHWTDGN